LVILINGNFVGIGFLANVLNGNIYILEDFRYRFWSNFLIKKDLILVFLIRDLGELEGKGSVVPTDAG
jgi:hypothetical protein